MSITLTHRGLPAKSDDKREHYSRFDLLRLFETVAKPQFKLSRTAIALVRQYILKTSDDDYQEGRVCAVWQQVSKTAQALNLTPRSINAAERELIEAGFVARSSGGNGARCGDRRNGRIIWAAGINLAPLIERFAELQACSEAMQLHNCAVNQCKAEIRQINRRVRESGNADIRAMAEGVLPDGRTARIANLSKLEAIRGELEAVLALLETPARAQKISDASEENFARNIPSENHQNLCGAGQPIAAPEPRLTPRLVMSLATHEFCEAVDMFGDVGWPAIIEAASQVGRQVGIDQRTWGKACERFGREAAALCVVIILRNAALNTKHRYHAKKPNGCLAGMVKKSAAGKLNIAGMIGAIWGRERCQSPETGGVQ